MSLSRKTGSSALSSVHPASTPFDPSGSFLKITGLRARGARLHKSETTFWCAVKLGEDDYAHTSKAELGAETGDAGEREVTWHKEVHDVANVPPEGFRIVLYCGSSKKPEVCGECRIGMSTLIECHSIAKWRPLIAAVRSGSRIGGKSTMTKAGELHAELLFIDASKTAPPLDDALLPPAADSIKMAATATAPGDKELLQVARETVETERAYCADLGFMLRHIARPAAEGKVLFKEDVYSLFSNLEALLPLNLEIAREFVAAVNECTSVAELSRRLAATFEARAPQLKIYGIYCSNQIYAVEKLEQLQRNNPAFGYLMRRANMNPDFRGMPPSSYLIKPLQRLCKYPLLLRELVKATPREPADVYIAMQSAARAIKEAVDEVNERTRGIESIKKLQDIKANTPDLQQAVVKKGRILKRDAEVSVDGRPAHLLYLFSDVCIVLRKLEDKRWQPVTFQPLQNIFVHRRIAGGGGGGGDDHVDHNSGGGGGGGGGGGVDELSASTSDGCAVGGGSADDALVLDLRVLHGPTYTVQFDSAFGCGEWFTAITEARQEHFERENIVDPESLDVPRIEANLRSKIASHPVAPEVQTAIDALLFAASTLARQADEATAQRDALSSALEKLGGLGMVNTALASAASASASSASASASSASGTASGAATPELSRSGSYIDMTQPPSKSPVPRSSSGESRPKLARRSSISGLGKHMKKDKEK